MIKTWRRRWFVLKQGKIFWFLTDKVTATSQTRGVMDVGRGLHSFSFPAQPEPLLTQNTP